MQPPHQNSHHRIQPITHKPYKLMHKQINQCWYIQCWVDEDSTEPLKFLSASCSCCHYKQVSPLEASVPVTGPNKAPSSPHATVCIFNGRHLGTRHMSLNTDVSLHQVAVMASVITHLCFNSTSFYMCDVEKHGVMQTRALDTAHFGICPTVSILK